MSKKAGKHKKDKKSAPSAELTCELCRNFKPGKGSGSGYCKRKDKKRKPREEVCGHFDPR